MKLQEFVRLFPLRAKNLAWFFGAGTSAAAGIPTAYDMIGDFKRTLFTSSLNLDIRHYSNLSDPIVRAKIQSFCDAQEGFPELNSAEEYSFYFEKYLGNEKDRWAYISEKVSGVSPSYGHRVLAGMIKMGVVRYLVTTNFDKAVENAVAQLYQNVESLYVASIENNQSVSEQLSREQLPLLIKIHGDYHSVKLKNTKEELQSQDIELRKAFERICLSNGLAVIGYSGRDESVMTVLTDLANNPNSFPKGLFWFTRPGGSLLPQVKALIERASSNGIDAHLVESETFDEVFGSVLNGLSDIPETIRAQVDVYRDRSPKQAIPGSGNRFPVIRLNGLPILEFPSTARLVDCEIGGSKELQEAIRVANADIIAIRKREGVIGFGADAAFKSALAYNSIKGMSMYNIPPWKLGQEESAFKDLFLSAIIRGLLTDECLKYTKRRSLHIIHVNPKHISESRLQGLSSLSYKSYGKLIKHEMTGIVSGTNLHWVDAIELSLSFVRNTLFLILQPTVITQKKKDIELGKTCGAFVKEKNAQRLNEGYNEILSAWIATLFKCEEESSDEVTLRTFSSTEGVSAHFKIGFKTVYAKS